MKNSKRIFWEVLKKEYGEECHKQMEQNLARNPEKHSKGNLLRSSTENADEFNGKSLVGEFLAGF